MDEGSCTTCGNPGDDVQLIECPDGALMCVVCLNGEITFEEDDDTGK